MEDEERTEEEEEVMEKGEDEERTTLSDSRSWVSDEWKRPGSPGSLIYAAFPPDLF